VSLDRVLQIVGPHCDLEKRLGDVPPSAAQRGVWERGMEAALVRHGKLAAFHEVFPQPRPSILVWQPISEFLPRLALAGALIASPERVHEGMFEIGQGNATVFTDSAIGRVLIRLLNPDPTRVIEQGAAARRQSYTYGRWKVLHPEPRRAQMVMSSEYIWIESYFKGSAFGTYDAIGCRASVSARLDDPYNGVIDITW
jgi:uncharacterized protein (TIGR02265 family)